MGPRKFFLDGNYKLLLTDLGVDLPRFLRQAKLPYNLFDISQPMVTADEYYRIWKIVTDYDAEMMLPLKAGMAVQPEMFSPVLIVALFSQNGWMALERVIKYKQLIAPMIFELHPYENYIDIEIKSEREEVVLSLGLVLFEMVFMNRLLCIGTRKT